MVVVVVVVRIVVVVVGIIVVFVVELVLVLAVVVVAVPVVEVVCASDSLAACAGRLAIVFACAAAGRLRMLADIMRKDLLWILSRNVATDRYARWNPIT